MKPRIFIGSSSESLDVAHAVKCNFETFGAKATVWEGLFRPSDYPLEALFSALESADFGVFVFSRDDVVKIREREYSAVRDNVILELGLFMGRLGKDWCFILKPAESQDLRLPSDLAGLTAAHYNIEDDGNIIDDLCSPCYRVYEKMRNKLDSDKTKKSKAPDGDHIAHRRPTTILESSLAVIVGDRRETPPETPGDFFAASASSRDLTWIFALGLPQSTVLWNDKIISATERENSIPEQVKNRDLIIVGSPYCNLIARRVNETAFFRFNIDPFVLRKIEQVENRIRGLERHSPELIQIFKDLGNAYGEMVYPLRSMGFVDPIRELPTVGVGAGQEHDFATVSFCRHPFSEQRKALLVAGLHLPGTMAAVKQLASPNFFQARPLGGILKITIPGGEWYEKLTRSIVGWFTPAYDRKTLLSKLGDETKLVAEGKLGKKDVKAYRQLVETYRKIDLTQFLSTFTLVGQEEKLT